MITWNRKPQRNGESKSVSDTFKVRTKEIVHLESILNEHYIAGYGSVEDIQKLRRRQLGTIQLDDAKRSELRRYRAGLLGECKAHRLTSLHLDQRLIPKKERHTPQLERVFYLEARYRLRAGASESDILKLRTKVLGTNVIHPVSDKGKDEYCFMLLTLLEQSSNSNDKKNHGEN